MTTEHVSGDDKSPVLSWFADPETTTTVDLGPCRCPGQPHERDSADVRNDYGEGEVQTIYQTAALAVGPDGSRFVESAGDDLAITRFVRSWTLLDGDGKPVPITPEIASLLKGPPRRAILEVVNPAIERAGSLPNGSGAPSRDSSRGSASRTRTTRARR